MIDLAKRDPRKSLSKSFMANACGEKAWFDIHAPRPWVPNEAATFGSAVDAGCSHIIASIRSGQPADMDTALKAAAEVMLGSAEPVDATGVQNAIEAFVAIPFDWTFCKIGMKAGSTEAFTMRLELDGVGGVSAHPDIVLRDHSIWDIKTSKRKKSEDAAAVSYSELGFYAICYEALTSETVPEVGYLTWTRTKTPGWQQVFAPVTDEMRDRAYATARRWAAAIRDSSPEINNTFTYGPKYGCGGCQYHPSMGGACEIALPLKEEAA